MANLKVGTGITFDGATGNINAGGVITSRGLANDNNIGINTNSITTDSLVGAASSFRGIYIDDGFIGFNTTMDRVGGYYIATHVNGLNAGPVTLGSTMTLDGTWVIV